MSEEPDKEERDEKERLTEAQRTLYFEYYKHLTTLTVATTLVLLAIYREVSMQSSSAWLVLSLLAASLFLAGFGLAALPIGGNRQRLHYWLATVAGAAFLSGVVLFATFAVTGI